ncbi:Ribonuclease E [hydrothermal vent metagenome]|uniref:Ribonuclease G n=1 Tax=hydrothermal vent metagenome TaxID=652676 RepID=A0A3B0YCX6_9ZZZZ
MKRILINALQKEETRVAMVDGQQLYDLDIEVSSREQKKASIYKGTITRVEPSLEAAFVDYGADRHGFLPFKEISRSYFSEAARNASGRPDIRTAVKEGTQVIVQVDKEERGNKGAALTTFMSLAGRYLVLMPNNPRAGGVSRRIEGDDRKEIREAMSGLNIPQGMGLIVRTAGVGRATEELQWDMDYQVQVWKAIEAAAAGRKAPFLIYQESNVIIRALRDYFRDDIGEILIDNPDVYKTAEDFVKQVMPNSQRKLKLYRDDVPMFNRYQIEGQIESAFQREVNLPSGGAIVIDHTEALISIDINSARATKGSDIEETATNTNLEASDEIARQLRLRDLGGLVVIDFIDMMANKNQRAVENRLRDALKMDRARVQIGRISRFGLLEMSRQRLRPSLGEATQNVCPRCNGYGTIRNIESLSLSLLRIAEEESLKEHTGRVIIQVPVEVSTFIFNEKRKDLIEIEKRTGVEISFIANKSMVTPHYEVSRLRASESAGHEGEASYKLADVDDQVYVPNRNVSSEVEAEKPAVRSITPSQPAPVVEKKAEEEPGLLSRFIKSLFGDDQPGEAEKKNTQGQQKNGGRQTTDRQNDRGRGRSGGRRNDNRHDSRNRNQKQDGLQGRPGGRQTTDQRDSEDKRSTNRRNTEKRNDGRQQQNRQKDHRNQVNRKPDNRPESRSGNFQENKSDNRNKQRHDQQPVQDRHTHDRSAADQSAQNQASAVSPVDMQQDVQPGNEQNSQQAGHRDGGARRGNRRGRGRRSGSRNDGNRNDGTRSENRQQGQSVSSVASPDTSNEKPADNVRPDIGRSAGTVQPVKPERSGYKPERRPEQRRSQQPDNRAAPAQLKAVENSSPGNTSVKPVDMRSVPQEKAEVKTAPSSQPAVQADKTTQTGAGRPVPDGVANKTEDKPVQSVPQPKQGAPGSTTNEKPQAVPQARPRVESVKPRPSPEPATDASKPKPWEFQAQQSKPSASSPSSTKPEVKPAAEVKEKPAQPVKKAVSADRASAKKPTEKTDRKPWEF